LGCREVSVFLIKTFDTRKTHQEKTAKKKRVFTSRNKKNKKKILSTQQKKEDQKKKQKGPKHMSNQRPPLATRKHEQIVHANKRTKKRIKKGTTQNM
jgi:hypothetical protein